MSIDPNIKIIKGSKQTKQHSSKTNWLLFIILLLAATALLFSYLLLCTTALDGLKRFFKYLGIDEVRFQLENADSVSYAAVDDHFAIAASNGVILYDDEGSFLTQISGSFSAPTLKSNDEYLLFYDIGGKALSLCNNDGDFLFELSVPRAIFDAEVSEDGFVSVLYDGAESRAVLEIYTQDGARIYRRNSNTKYLNACAISPDGTFTAVATLNRDDLTLKSAMQYLKTAQDEVHAEISIGSRVIYDIRFTDDTHTCAISADGLLFFDHNGDRTAEFEGDLMLYTFDGDGFVAAIFRQAGNQWHLLTLDTDGSVITEEVLDGQPRSVSAQGDYLAVLTDRELLIYDSDLDLRNSTKNSNMLYALARDDGTAVCIFSGEAALFIP